MKNRVLLTMLIIFIVLSCIWITCGTIFVVREIEVIDVTNVLTEEEKSEIASQSGLLGKNILFNLNEDKIAKEIKSVDSSIKLQSVKAEFPSRVVLKVSRSLPVYHDAENQIYLDADMCVVKENLSVNYIDITNANLNLNQSTYEFGDKIIGSDERTQCKIEQLKIVANYFTNLQQFDMKQFEISYNDDPACVGASLVCLNLVIKDNVEFEIKTLPSDDFLKALDFTVQIYQREMVNGVYKTLFDESKDVVTIIGDEEYREEK